LCESQHCIWDDALQKSTNSTSGEGERRGLWQRATLQNTNYLSEVQPAVGQQLSNNSARKSQSRFKFWLAAEAWIGFQITWRPSVSLQARLSGIWSKLRPPGSFLNAGNSSPICSPWIRQVMSRNTYIVIHEGSF
jgi:hypothetical protein